MAYKTFVAGEEALAADVNSYLMSQAVVQFPSIATRDASWASPPAGAVCVTTDQSRVWQRIGSAWVLIAGKMPAFRVTGGGAGQVINNNAVTQCSWVNGAEPLDTDNVIAVGTGTFTCPMSGYWALDFTVVFDAYGTAGVRVAWIGLAADADRYGAQAGPWLSGFDSFVSGSAVRLLTAGATMAVNAFQTSGIALGTNKVPYSAFAGRYLGPP